MRIIALFNLKPGITPADYEQWARTRDLPGVRSLVSVADFEIYRSTGVLFRDGEAPPFQYVEVLDITELDEFMTDCSSDIVKQLVPEMSAYAEQVTFITTERLSEVG